MISARMAMIVIVFALTAASWRDTHATEPRYHAVHYQGAWPGGSATSTPPTVDRYAQPQSSAPQTFAPPPGVVDRAQTAVAETGTAFGDAARDVGQGFGDQLRDFSRSATRQFESTGNNLRNTAEQTFGATADGLRRTGETIVPNSAGASPAPVMASAPSRVSAPPWPASSATTNSPAAAPAPWTAVNPPAPRTTITSLPGGGWTSLSADTPPPHAATPPLRNDVPSNVGASNVGATNIGVNTGGANTGGGTTGPQFPTLPPPTGIESLANPRTNAQPTTSPPAAAQPPASNADVRNGVGIPDLGTSWTTNGTGVPPSIGRSAAPTPIPGQTGGERGQQPLPSELRSGVAPVQPSSSGDHSAANDPFNQPPQAWPGSQPRWPATVNDPQTTARPATPASTSPAPTATERPPQPRTQATTAPEKAAGPGPEPTAKWMPLILVSLTLIGSLSANLFLGWSYVDARQKYRTLVRKTADKFCRAAEAI